MAPGEGVSAAQIKVDVSEDDQAYRIHAEIPGAKKEDIKISIDGDVVSISAETRRQSEQKEGERIVRSERYYGTASRAFSLGGEVDESKCNAKYQDGVLELVLPKKAGGRVRQIAVQ
jgi:HSP20 family protein